MKKKHADLIIAWANGAAIQYRKDAGMMWTDSPDPAWVDDYEYRVKPAREYPKLDAEDVRRIADYFCFQNSSVEIVSQKVLQVAIDHGQVVTREEFDRAIGDRDSRDLKVVQAAIDHFEPSLKLFKLQVPQAWQLQAVIREWVK